MENVFLGRWHEEGCCFVDLLDAGSTMQQCETAEFGHCYATGLWLSFLGHATRHPIPSTDTNTLPSIDDSKVPATTLVV